MPSYDSWTMAVSTMAIVLGQALSLLFCCTCLLIFNKFQERTDAEVEQLEQHQRITPQSSDINTPPQRSTDAILQFQNRQLIESRLMLGCYDADTQNEKDEDRTCAVCLSEFKKGEKLAQSTNSECRHVFHQKCVVDWLVKHPECPVCRRHFLDSEQV
jgi:hypothetical protein